MQITGSKWLQLCSVDATCSRATTQISTMSFGGKRQNVVLRRRCLPKIREAKEMYFNKDGSAIKRLQAGVNQLADLIGVTLGPKGRNVILSDCTSN
ncbi:chaperonin 60 subunit beta 3, chloroplastic-like [Papaver somniferum]|uniref:chaperonin 60 subunit beta 3, chloroplastic-like n=1 Tax=Papaver somniferum TaxID=3469 RepID=UPI000E6F475D|nr:chaperonin 60 subunit beta 3, chloroplastic-like [Papaver somniferum]